MSHPGPLAGVLVVDVTRVLAGPYCTLVLADLGARVIKVEAPGKGDDARQIGPFIGGRSAYFMSLRKTSTAASRGSSSRRPRASGRRVPTPAAPPTTSWCRPWAV
jgi:CoA:oxalate CoA-transferase